VSLREISDATNISVRYLEALEESRFDILPAPVFARGFLRQYARYVGLDADEVVNSYLQAHGAGQAEEAVTVLPSRPRREWVSGAVMVAAMLLLLAGVAALALLVERSGETEAAPPPQAAPPVAAAPPAPAAQPTQTEARSPLLVTLDFEDDCWVEATIDGERRVSQLHLQGESLRLEAQERVLLTLGEPGAVRVEVNGEPYSLADFPPGRPARELLIELPEPAPSPATG
jgi:cytoskeletal protein RodZ